MQGAILRIQKSNKLGTRRYGPFQILEILSQNAVRLAFPTHIFAHTVVYVEHTLPYQVQPSVIAKSIPTISDPVTNAE